MFGLALAVAGGLFIFRSFAATPSSGADLNGDGVVNLTDLSILLSHYGQSGATAAQGDIDGNGSVNLTDLSILLSNYGKTVTPTPTPRTSTSGRNGSGRVNTPPARAVISENAVFTSSMAG